MPLITSLVEEVQKAVKVTTFSCSNCGFKDAVEDVVAQHYIQLHMKTKTPANATNLEVRWFESRDDVRLWVKSAPASKWKFSLTSTQWEGPGWYYMRPFRNNADRLGVSIEPVRHRIEHLLDEIKHCNREIRDLQALQTKE